MILNLKRFIDFLLVPNCKLESIEDVLNLITEGCCLASVGSLHLEQFLCVKFSTDILKTLKSNP